MTWDISCPSTGGSVSFPVTGQPDKVIKKSPAFYKEIDIPGDALILSFGSKAIAMEWSGVMAAPGKDNAQLYTDYFSFANNKLERFKHYEVTIGGTTPARYQGNWILTDVQFEERAGVLAALWYKLTFLLGGTHSVM